MTNKNLNLNRHGVFENVEKRSRNNLVNMVFADSNNLQTEESRVAYVEIPVESITPRAVNQYKQNRIERLAKSIQNTNNRLIHPIVLVKACDLPDDHEVIRRFREKGVDISKLEYILVAGERRYRAWMLLREREAARLKGQLGVNNPFDTITANVLTRKEAKLEENFFEDSNIESRQLTPMEGVLHVQAAMEEVNTNQKKREALIEMNGGSEEGIHEDPDIAARKFNTAAYCQFYLSSELGIEGWNLSTIRNYMAVLNNCCEEVIDAILDGSYVIRAARTITSFTEEEQKELVVLWQSGNKEAYDIRFKEIHDRYASPARSIRYTHRDAKRQISVISKKVIKERSALKNIADHLGGDDKVNATKAIRRVDTFLKELDELMEELS